MKLTDQENAALFEAEEYVIMRYRDAAAGLSRPTPRAIEASLPRDVVRLKAIVNIATGLLAEQNPCETMKRALSIISVALVWIAAMIVWLMAIGPPAQTLNPSDAVQAGPPATVDDARAEMIECVREAGGNAKIFYSDDKGWWIECQIP